MKLIRIQKGKKRKVIFEGTINEVADKIHEMDLEDYHDAFFYEHGKFENMGVCGEDTWDYYMISK